jgi:membrane AbrB-like protein
MPLPSLTALPIPLRWTILLLASALFTAGLEAFHLPAALLLGPMAAAILLAIRGADLKLPDAGMTMAQSLVGLMIATLLPTGLWGEVARQWPIVVSGTLFTILASSTLGWALARTGLLPGTTAIWGSAPGAASVMTILSADHGADIRLVAFMQYLRVACVALSATLVARAFGVTHMKVAEIVWFPPTPWADLAVTILAAFVLGFGGQRLRLPGGSFLTPMVVGLVLVQGGWMRFDLPPWLLALSFGAIGWAIGLRFTPAILAHAARVFPRVFASVLGLIAVCGGAGWVLVLVAGIDPLTAYLATSPGGADSVAIISASTDVDVPFVMAMQMSRFLLVLITGPWLARALSRRQVVAGSI